MASPTPVEKDEFRQFAPVVLSSRLHGSRSMPDLSCAEVNLHNTHPASAIAVQTSPPNVPASPEAVKINQVGQPATAAKTTELHESTQPLSLFNNDSDLRCTVSAPDLAGSASVPVLPAAERLVFPLDYDYLEKVKSLCDSIGPELYHDLFESHFQEAHGEIFLISKQLTGCILSTSDNSNDKWEHLDNYVFSTYWFLFPYRFPRGEKQATPRLDVLRNLVTSATQEDPHVLIIESIDLIGVQLLGRLFDIDPSFIAQHLGARSRLETWHESELGILSHHFKNFVNHRDRIPGHGEESIKSTPQAPPWYSMEDYLFENFMEDNPWPGAGSDRLDRRHGKLALRPRVSYYQVSRYSCKTYSILRWPYPKC
jgi:hypothetical protein